MLDGNKTIRREVFGKVFGDLEKVNGFWRERKPSPAPMAPVTTEAPPDSPVTDKKSPQTPSEGEKLDDKYAGYFGAFRAVVSDGHCGEPIGWGYEPNAWLGEALFKEVESSLKGARWHCHDVGRWVLVTRHLTPHSAIKKYGPITQMRVGPRGGYKTVTYGDKMFGARELDPRNIPDITIDPSLVVTE